MGTSGFWSGMEGLGSSHSVLITNKKLNKLKKKSTTHFTFVKEVLSEGKPLPHNWRDRQVDTGNYNLLAQKTMSINLRGNL